MNNKRFPLVVAFHGIHRQEEPHDRYSILDADLDRLLVLLGAQGRRFLTLAAICSQMHTMTCEVSDSLCALTFDDAYAGLADIAVPILNRHNAVATVFPITGAVGLDNSWNRRASVRLQHCSWDELTKLAACGWEIGSHTHNHFNSQSLTAQEFRDEIALADKALQAHLGIRPDCLAYPYGKATPQSLAVARSRFSVAVGTENGGTDWTLDRWFLQRITPYSLIQKLSDKHGPM